MKSLPSILLFSILCMHLHVFAKDQTPETAGPSARMPTFTLASPGSDDSDDDLAVFEMESFAVYEGAIDVIDGITGESYHRDNHVVRDFRSSFNNLLLAHHKKLLIDEVRYAKFYLKCKVSYSKELDLLSEQFRFPKVDLHLGASRHTEKTILSRLYKDPFFKISSMVVWHLDDLEDYKETAPASIYAKDIRFNSETQQWERRVTTEWIVNAGKNPIIKQQGLELDNNRGYHLVNRRLPHSVRAKDFKEVEITYPVFIDPLEPAELQVEKLTTNTAEQPLLHLRSIQLDNPPESNASWWLPVQNPKLY